jgi:hypothetical protein
MAATGFVPVAWACSPIGYEHSGSPLPVEHNVAAAMVRRASSVYLVTAESSRPFDVDSLLPSRSATTPEGYQYQVQEVEGMRPWALLMNFRVLETLKGTPSAELQLGVLREGSPLEDRREWARARGRFLNPAHYWLSDSEPLGLGFMLGGCVEPIRAEIGSNYLIFLDETGQLLDAKLEFRREGRRRATASVVGPRYAEVFGEDDPWLVAVRREAVRSRPRD